MGNLRELGGRSCLSTNLGMSDFSERDIDRVAAMGGAAAHSDVGALGTDVWRWMYSLDRYAALRVCKRLVVALQRERGVDAMVAVRVAQQAMLEFSEWACASCGGRKEMELDNGVKIVCETCGGTGYRKYTNGDRSRGTGQVYRAVAEDLEWTIALLRAADGLVNSRMNHELERK
jgi:hypothetical protein